jgi:hypothetical protein
LKENGRVMKNKKDNKNENVTKGVIENKKRMKRML